MGPKCYLLDPHGVPDEIFTRSQKNTNAWNLKNLKNLKKPSRNNQHNVSNIPNFRCWYSFWLRVLCPKWAFSGALWASDKGIISKNHIFRKLEKMTKMYRTKESHLRTIFLENLKNDKFDQDKGISSKNYIFRKPEKVKNWF